jgi:hypothetical protein
MATAPHSRRAARLRAIAALATTAGLVVTGCAEQAVPTAPQAEPQPAPTTAGEATIAWTDSVCSALVPVVDALRTPPPVDFTDAAATREAYLSYIDEALRRAEQAVQDVEDAGPPPVAGGDELAQDVRDQVTDLRDDLAEARQQVDAADPNDPAAIGQAVAVAGDVLGSLGNSAHAAGVIAADPRLRPAFEQAESCDQLASIGDPP